MSEEEVLLRPRRIKSSLNKELLKENIQLNEFNNFKKNLTKLITESEKASNNSQGEENLKNLLSDFFKDTYYKNKYFINTMSYKGRNEADLVIHSENSQDSNVSVIFEVKTLKNKAEMLSNDIIEKKSPENLLKDSFYEAVLYFFHEFKGKNNIELKNIIITNVFEYYIFDASEFKRVFIDRSTILLKIFEKWKSNALIDSKTDTFYNQVKDYINNHPEYLNNLRFTYFDIRKIKEEEELKLLYKILSPKHLLKQSFSNDSNTLNKDFYNELLHIIGLEEVEKGSQKLIQRKKDKDLGSLLESTIKYIEDNDKLENIINKASFGITKDEVLFNISLSLCIRWINRILFLKLLEGQLYNYHKGDKNYKFLDFAKVKTFKRLNRIFFSVLAKKTNERDKIVQEEFFRIPYLNSSLFEVSELEKQTIEISFLEDDLNLSIYKNTVLRDDKNKKIKDKTLTTLEYLLNFLNSYDFGAEDIVNNDVSEERKTLINASVLGLIFEKINGYKDGSFYTPSFITTYMCREAISKAIIKKFNEKFNWECENLEELEFLVFKKKIDLKVANELVNSLRICDPAVGSGHFLVSALNEIIAIKSQLGILCDDKNNRLFCTIENKNDELEIRNKNEELFEYKVKTYTDYNPVTREIGTELTKIQKALFFEKKYLIENCLFGVDLNNNSVMICRLRLWIELLKNAFYTEESNYIELETLPNIDINIKQGNSLISRYDLEVNLGTVFKKEGFRVKDYRDAVRNYKETNSKEDKKKLIDYIENIKAQFKTELAQGFLTKVQSTENEIKQMLSTLFSLDKESKKKIVEKQKKLAEMIKQKEEIASNEMYKEAFEWRFEFPEVLDETGNFIGFDVIVGNPPYIQIQSFTITQKESWKKQNYQTFEATGDLYCLFYEKGNQLLKNKGLLCYITSNKWMYTNYGKTTRKYFVENTNPILLIDFGYNQQFIGATTYTNILVFKKEKNESTTTACSLQNLKAENTNPSLHLYEYINKNKITLDNLTEESWIILSKEEYDIKKKIESVGVPLKDWDISIYRGILTGFNEAFIIDAKKKDELIKADPKSAEIIKPILRGRDIKRYKADFADLWIINSHNGIKSKNILPINVMKYYPIIYEHLKQYQEQLEKRLDKGEHWTNLRNCAYLEEFEKEKIVWLEISQGSNFVYNVNSTYILNTAYMITGKNLKYLLAILNSNIINFYFKFITTEVSGGSRRYTNQYVIKIPIPQIPIEQQKPFEMMVDFIIFAKENDFEMEAKTFESVVDGMVYDLYFPEEMKKRNCYLTDRIKEIVLPFKETDTIEQKKEHIRELNKLCSNDKIIYGSLIYRRFVDVVRITSGKKDE